MGISKGSHRLSPNKVIPVCEAEARRAAAILGVRGVFFERYLDGDLDLEYPVVLRGAIMAKICEVQANA